MKAAERIKDGTAVMSKSGIFDFNKCIDALKDYCQSSGLCFEKALEQVKSYDLTSCFLLHFDPDDPDIKKGLADNKPMPIVLKLFISPDGTYSFEQTENTHTYLT